MLRNDEEESYESLLEEYQTLIRRQQTSIEELEKQLQECQKKLSNFSKQTIQSKIDSILESHENETESQNLEEVKILKQQLDDALKEKELVNLQHEYTMKELQAMRSRTFGVTVDEDVEFKLPPTSTDTEIIKILEEELERLRRVVLASEEENIKLMKDNEDLKNQIKLLENEVIDLQDNLLKSRKLSPEIQEKVVKQDELIQKLQKEYQELGKEKGDLQNSMARLKSKFEEEENKIYESLKLAEEALIEKDAALLREKHSLEDAKKLEDQMKLVVEENSQKIKLEVEKTSENLRKKVKALTEELSQLQLSFNGKQLDFEKCCVERDKIASENERLIKELKHTKEEREEEYSRTYQRVRELEKKYSIVNIEKENLLKKFNKVNEDYKHNFEGTFYRIRELERRLCDTLKEMERIKKEKEDAQNERDILRSIVTSERENAKKKENQMIRHLEEKERRLRKAVSEEKIDADTIQKSHKKLITQLYSTIEALKRRITALQTDHKTQSSIYEGQISKLNQDLDQLKTQNISLTKLLQESDKTNFSLNEELRRNKQRISTLEIDLGNSKESFTKLLKATKVS